MRPGSAIFFGSLSMAVMLACMPEPAAAQLFTTAPDLYSIFTPTATPAEAHDADGPVGVIQRMTAQFEPQGFWIDGQHIVPSATVSSIYDDNIFATETRATGDDVSHFRPAIDADNGQREVSYNFDFSGDFAKYASHPSLDNLNAAFGLGIASDITSTFRIESRTNFLVNHADPANFVLPIANAAVSHLPETQSFNQQISLARDVGAWGLEFIGGYNYANEENLSLDGLVIPFSALN
jgi:hypothetical protein